MPTHLSPVLLLQSHVLLIDRARKFWLAGEDDVMLEDHGFDKIIHLWLPSNSVIRICPPQQAWTEANSQVVGLHHVLITVLRHTRNMHTNTQTHWTVMLAWMLSFMTIADTASDRISHTGLSCSLLIEESKKVTHYDEERPWEGGDNHFNLGSFLCHPLDFCTWQKGKRKGAKWQDEQKKITIITSFICCSYNFSMPAAIKSSLKNRCLNHPKFCLKEKLSQVLKLLWWGGWVDMLGHWREIYVFMGSKQPAGSFKTLISCANCDSEFLFYKAELGTRLQE